MKTYVPISKLITCCLLLTFASGCGSSGDTPELSSVEGVVKKDGKPLASASVTFYPSTGRQSVGETDESGHFQLIYTSDQKGAVVGEHQVHFTFGGRQEPSGPSTPTSKSNSDTAIPYQEVDWPEKVQVEKSDNKFVFDL